METLRRRYFGKSVATEEFDTAKKKIQKVLQRKTLIPQKKKSKIIGCREKRGKLQGRCIVETRLYREVVMGWCR